MLDGNQEADTVAVGAQAAQTTCILHCIKSAAGRMEAVIYLVMTQF